MTAAWKRVTGIDGAQAWAKAGIMIRQSLAPSSRHDSFFISPGNGAAVYQRRYVLFSGSEVTCAWQLLARHRELARTDDAATGHLGADDLD
jgi:hypothetical protein